MLESCRVRIECNCDTQLQVVYSQILFCQIYFAISIDFTVLQRIFFVLCTLFIRSLIPSILPRTISICLSYHFGIDRSQFSIREIVEVLREGLKKNQRSSWEILQARRRVWSFSQIVIRRQFIYVLIVRLCPFLSIQTF